jgi:hypothetical protein
MTAKRLVLIPLLTLMVAACHKDTTTSPTSTTTTTTTNPIASPTTTDSFDGQLGILSTTYFTYDVTVYGTVNATLVSISGAGVPSTVQVRLALGTVTDDSCAATSTATATAGSTAQLTTTEQPGTYCVSVADVGNLSRPAAFTVTVAHP